jgi:hypothetical protein
MLRILGLMVVLCALVGGFGYYRGWFHAESNNGNGQSTLSVTMDKEKIEQDKSSAQSEVRDLGHK